MNEQEMQKRLTALRKAMSERGIREPSPDVTIEADRLHVYMMDNGFGDFGFFRGDTVEDCMTAAEKHVAKLPDPEPAGHRKYMKQLGKALDIAREESVDDRFTVGARQSMDVISEHLLEGPK